MNELKITFRLCWHVVVRNWVVYRKDFIANISPTLADPALMMLALGVGLSPFIGKIDGLTYAQFLAPGMVATTALFTAFFESSYGFYVKMTFESVFKAMLTTPVGTREIVLGEYLWSLIRAGLMAFVVGLVLAAMNLLPNLWALLFFPVIGGVLSVPCAALGLIAAAQVRNINQFQTVYSFLIAPIYYLSGVFFPIVDRPVLSFFMQCSPFYHGVRLLQMTAWGEVDWGAVGYHTAMLFGFTLVLCWWAMRRIQRKLIL